VEQPFTGDSFIFCRQITPNRVGYARKEINFERSIHASRAGEYEIYSDRAANEGTLEGNSRARVIAPESANAWVEEANWISGTRSGSFRLSRSDCRERRTRERKSHYEEGEVGASREDVHKFDLPGQSHEYARIFIFLYLHEIVKTP